MHHHSPYYISRIGRDVSSPAIVAAKLANQESYETVVCLYEVVPYVVKMAPPYSGIGPLPILYGGDVPLRLLGLGMGAPVASNLAAARRMTGPRKRFRWVLSVPDPSSFEHLSFNHRPPKGFSRFESGITFQLPLQQRGVHGFPQKIH